jgi:ABC-2 type transport system ATP-binding protein
MGTILDVLGLRKAFGPTVALNDVSLAIPEGSIVGLLGPNGAGKTTLMKVLVGLIKPDAGEVRVGHPNGRASVAAIGAMIERPGFYPYLSARRNLEALGLTAGISRGMLNEHVPAILERVDLRKAADRKFAGFSTGMKQRLALAAALLGSRDVLILDEPVSGLDPAGVASVRRLLLELRSEGRTILVSSHLLGEVEQVCDRIAIINLGRVLANGPISEIASGPATWHLSFAAGDQAQRAALLLSQDFLATTSGSEVHAVSRDRSEVTPLEVVMPHGLVPREATLQQPSLEAAYLRLIGGPSTEPVH